MYFNREISERLLYELSGGAFSWLPAACQEHDRLDLQLRGYPKMPKQQKPEYRATAYVGTTKVLDVYERNDEFKVRATESAQRWSGVDLPWTTLER